MVKVIDWINYEEAKDLTESVGGLGGFFENGMRWKDYIEVFPKNFIPYLEAIRDSVIENKLRYTGEFHQYGDTGVPVFSDNTCASMSYRAWADLMAAIWSEHEDKDYNYMDFYM